MAQSARGRFLLLLNNDAYLAPTALACLAARAATLEQDAVLGLPQFDAVNGELVDRGSILDPFFNPIPNLDPNRRDVAHIIGACLWLPRSLWFELGGFPDHFISLAEDLYLCCRARLAGYPVQIVQDSRFYHHIGYSLGGGAPHRNIATKYSRRRRTETNKNFVIFTCTPAPVFYLLWPIHILVLTIEGLALSALTRSSAPWTRIYAPALSDTWQMRGELTNQRRIVQRQRQKPTLSFFSAFTPIPFKLRVLFRKGLPQLS